MLLYEKVWPNVKRYVKKNSGDEDNAKDIFHDGILKIIVMVKENRLDPDIDIGAYLYIMCRNFWIEKARRDRRMDITDENLDYKSFDNSSFTELLRSEKAAAMEEVLETIGEKCRELLKLTFYSEYSLEKAAEILGFSGADVAKSTQYRCKKKLVEKIKTSAIFNELLA